MNSNRKIQLIGFPNSGKTTLLNSLTNLSKPTSKIPGTTIHISDHKYKERHIIYDMPGLFCA
jgi:ribosome biogenesis GTPase A